MKITAGYEIDHFNLDGVEYRRDEDGNFNIDHPDHVEKALRLGGSAYDPNAPVFDHVEFGSIENEMLAAKDAEIAHLREQLAAATAAPEPSPIPDGTDTASDPVAAPGDTSETAGGTGDDTDKLAAALAENPDFEEMTRDDLVDWLDSVGVSISKSSSKEVARKVVDSTVADFNNENKG